MKEQRRKLVEEEEDEKGKEEEEGKSHKKNTRIRGKKPNFQAVLRSLVMQVRFHPSRSGQE